MPDVPETETPDREPWMDDVLTLVSMVLPTRHHAEKVLANLDLYDWAIVRKGADLAAHDTPPPADEPKRDCDTCGGPMNLVEDHPETWACSPCGAIQTPRAEGGQPDADDELLARADREWEEWQQSFAPEPDWDRAARLSRDLASALRRTREELREAEQAWDHWQDRYARARRELAETHDEIERLKRLLSKAHREANGWAEIAADRLAEARSHGEVLARVTTQTSGYGRRLEDGTIDADDGNTTSRLVTYHVPAPPGTEVLVVLAPTETTR